MSIELLSVCHLIRNAITEIAAISRRITAINCLQNIFQIFSVPYNSLCRWRYCKIFSMGLFVSINDGKHIESSSGSWEENVNKV